MPRDVIDNMRLTKQKWFVATSAAKILQTNQSFDWLYFQIL